ncbi:nucleobase:cation symporter-2 family protein [Saccharomycodes ludwigii]|uniref:nucleobase:cation symporter-2 family protein n=1 Tax=Saccharomycodes ludwigii TaxID=36035 RepID=UPI001E86BF4E|nr:conserved putative purine permease [Saccharomycodes ludwigii]KAH3900851.1 conserved putative purine permease [Saccharomycodes ludwigii]
MDKIISEQFSLDEENSNGDNTAKKSGFFNTSNFKNDFHKIFKKWTTRDGLFGDYDYAFLFTPSFPFHDWFYRRVLKREPRVYDQPFFGLDSDMPIALGFLLGLQHSLAMLAGVITPPLIISSLANFDDEIREYLVSASLIASGILSLVQMTRFHVYKTPYYIGDGLLTVVGTSFATITIVSKAFPMMYATGFCPVDAQTGESLPCPDGYGAMLGTACCCALLEILISFTPPAILQKVSPKIVTGPIILCIAISLIESGFEDWVGGSACVDAAYCPSEGAPMAAHWGAARLIGLGFLVFFAIIMCEKYGSPIMKSCAVIVGLIVGCIVAAACGYFDRSTVTEAPKATFIWVHTFKLTVYGPAVLPFLVVYIVIAQECIGDITATSDVSRQPVEGPLYESRIQGGVLADGLAGVFSGLLTMPPMSTFAQNNGVIALTKTANRNCVGRFCCFFLIIMGIFSQFGAALVAIPKPVLGGMTSFLFTSVAVSGLKIISSIPFTRRDRFILTAALLPGIGACLVPDWFSYFFTYSGKNHALEGFLNAIVLIMESGFAVCGFVSIILNLFIPQELDEELMDDIEIQQSNISVLEGRESNPAELRQVLSGKSLEAYGSHVDENGGYVLTTNDDIINNGTMVGGSSEDGKKETILDNKDGSVHISTSVGTGSS